MKVQQSERNLTLREYGERWRLSREVGWALETRKRVESNLRCHLYPAFGDRPLRAIHLTSVLEWLTRRLEEGTSEPKAGSSGTVDMDPVVGQVLAEHVREFPPVPVELVDLTSGDPVRRSVPLLFTTRRGNPFTDRTWSREWADWRDSAGWPKKHGTFHALRHFFPTTLITNHAEPQEVQRMLRHKTLRITLERTCTGGRSGSVNAAWWGRSCKPLR
ncbi:tyrosine-type recombinase/integrase [Micromonospora sp. NPDC093277]|uniref:tyrosine-type recombinase/integrase n=1 Tax=Micromonospora sp. NPDC093277 TaxID=3364291 RepID=UPI00380AE2D1